FGVLCEGNVHGMRQVNTNTFSFAPENYGLHPKMPPVEVAAYGKSSRPAGSREWPRFLDPRSAQDENPTGMGDYRPAQGSPLLATAITAQIDADARGQLRIGESWAAGAFEGDTVATIELWAASAAHLVGGVAPSISAAGALVPDNSLIGWGQGIVPVLTAGTLLAPALATILWGAGVPPQISFAFPSADGRPRTRRVEAESRRRVPESD
ncbi:MAG: hypothetical protein SNJ63_02165, partial [Sphingomonadaceae bacterium]